MTAASRPPLPPAQGTVTLLLSPGDCHPPVLPACMTTSILPPAHLVKHNDALAVPPAWQRLGQGVKHSLQQQAMKSEAEGSVRQHEHAMQH